MKTGRLRKLLLLLLACGAANPASAGQSGAGDFDGYLGVWD